MSKCGRSGCDGERYGSGLDIEKLYPIAPFLKDFLGTSMATTKRGNFRFGNGEWIHLDARFGNHFFIKANLIDEFLRRFEKIPKGRICREGLAVAIDILREGATTSSL